MLAQALLLAGALGLATGGTPLSGSLTLAEAEHGVEQACSVQPAGCYFDKSPAPGVPVVRAVARVPLLTTNLSSVTVEACSSRCASLGFNYSAWTGSTTSGHYTCYCDCSINEAAKVAPPSACDQTCPGDGSGKCGDDGVESVYVATKCSPPIVPATVCPGSGGLPKGRACSQKEAQKWPFCDPSLPIAERVEDLVGRVLLRDAGPLLTARESEEVPYLGIPPFYWGTNAIHGIVNNAKCFAGNCPTTFPQALNLASTFNRSLVTSVGAVIGREMRALANLNASQDGLASWAPTINLIRDPRWGRNQETASEDPYAAGEYGTAFTRGLQAGDAAGGNGGSFLLGLSTLKHIAAYSLEDYSPSGNFSQHTFTRQNFSATVNQHDLYDSYLVPFKRSVQGADAQGVMYSCSELNGVPGIDSAFLAGELASWGFNGYRTSDGGQVAQTVSDHHYVPTILDSIQLAMRDGVTDIDDGGSYGDHLLEALQQGYVNASIIRRALANTFRVRMRLGLFDDPSSPSKPQPATKLGADSLNDAHARQLNVEAAQESLVLLRNEGAGRLPWLGLENSSVAVIGPLANSTSLLHGSYTPSFGSYCPEGYPCRARTLLEAVAARSRAGGVTYAPGMAANNRPDSTLLQAAVEAARAADRVVLLLGSQSFSPSEGGYEAEQHDRWNISLPWGQDELADAVLAAGKPVVVVLVHGGALAIDSLSRKAGVIVDAHYPGAITGANAVVSLIHGDFSPSGRLTYTVYPSSFQYAANFTHFSMTEPPGRTYRYYGGDPLFPFGWGLSYANWTIKILTDGSRFKTTDKIENTVTVSHDGGYDGVAKCSVLLFFRPVGGLEPPLPPELTPRLRLIDFTKLEMEPGSSSVWSPTVDVASNMTLTDASGSSAVHAGTYELIASIGGVNASHTFTITDS